MGGGQERSPRPTLPQSSPAIVSHPRGKGYSHSPSWPLASPSWRAVGGYRGIPLSVSKARLPWRATRRQIQCPQPGSAGSCHSAAGKPAPQTRPCLRPRKDVPDQTTECVLRPEDEKASSKALPESGQEGAERRLREGRCSCLKGRGWRTEGRGGVY